MAYLQRKALLPPIGDKEHDTTSQKIVNMYNKTHPRMGHEGPEGE